MTTFSKFMKQVRTKLVSENLMTDEIKAALASIEQPTKRKVSDYHILMKNILHQMVEKYPNVVHKIRFKMAAQIAGLIHKQNVSQELAWKIIIQRNFTNDDVKNNATLASDKGKKASANEAEEEQQDKASSSGVSSKKRRQNKEVHINTTAADNVSAPPAEIQMEDITHILKDNSEHNKPETEPTAVLISDDENEEENTDAEVEIEKAKLIKKKDDTNSLQFLREYVKNKVPTMHVNDRYKIVNKMKKLVNSVSDLASVDNAYTQIVN